MSDKEYKLVGEICTNICNRPQYLPDLIQEVSLIFLEFPDEKKEKVRKYFRYWLVRVVSNNWRSNSSPFWNKYRKIILIDPSTIYNQSEDQPEMEPKDSHADILDKLIGELYISDQNVFNDYYKEGLTIVQITKKYGVEKTYTWSVIDRIRNSLRRRVEWMEGNYIDFISLLLPLIGNSRLRVNDRQMILDINNHISEDKKNSVHDRMLVDRVLKELVVFFTL